jgi:hypothetical protein
LGERLIDDAKASQCPPRTAFDAVANALARVAPLLFLLQLLSHSAQRPEIVPENPQKTR